MGFIPDEIVSSGRPAAASQISVTNAGYASQQDVNDALLYVPLTVTGFGHSHGVQLKGSNLATVTLNWSYNKAVAGQTVAGQVLNSQNRSLQLNGVNLTTTTIYSLSATDGTNTRNATASVFFSNERIWGVGPAGLTSPVGLQTSQSDRPAAETRAHTLTVTAGVGQKIYYMRPARLGAGTYKVGGFEGGFIERIVSYTNAAGFSENYIIGESAADNLGTTTVTIS